MTKKNRNFQIVVETNKRFDWTTYTVVTPWGSMYTCGSMETAKKLIESLEKNR